MIAADPVQQVARPDYSPVMRQRWSDLLFLHWPVDASIIQRLVPAGLTVDTYQAQAYVALVPFRMWNVHPTWFVPVPGISDLLECNVRTYVRRIDGSDPGVWFFSLDADSAIAVASARIGFSLPYYHARMRQTEQRIRNETGIWHRRISYSTSRVHPGWSDGYASVIYEPEGAVSRALEGSLEQFLIERYLLYTYRNKTLRTGLVHHAPYEISKARVLSLDESLIAAAGIKRPDIEPLVHYARNVVVKIFPLQNVV